MANREIGELARGPGLAFLAAANIPLHPLFQVFDELIQFVRFSLGHQQHAAVRLVSYESCNGISGGDFARREAKTDPLNSAVELDLAAFGWQRFRHAGCSVA